MNVQWMKYFPNMDIGYLMFGVSDHSPILISLKEHKKNLMKPFRFTNHWTLYEDYMDKVKEGWHIDIEDRPMFQFTHKMKVIKGILVHWSKDKNNNRKEVEFRSECARLQRLLESNINENIKI